MSLIHVLKSMKYPIYTTEDSLTEAILRFDNALPGVPRNKLVALISVYHNTLIETLIEEVSK